MSGNWLTVQQVESLQERLEDGQEIDSLVSSLRGATLPALMEYGCLRWASGSSVPQLPIVILSSTIGKALHDIPSPLGIRKGGAGRAALRHIGALPAEFYVIGAQEELDGENWKAFGIRFNRSTQSAGFSSLASDGMHAALLEMVDNAVIHASATVPIMVGYRVLHGVTQFCVADVGIGVLESLRSCPDFSHLRFDNQAIKEALRDGVSRFGRYKGGLGFREVFKSLTSQWGILRFRSGEGCIMMDGTDLSADQGREEFPPRLPGFQVTISCRTSDSTPVEPLV